MCNLLLIKISPALIDPVGNHAINEYLFPSTLEHLRSPCGCAVPAICDFVIVANHVGGDAGECLAHMRSIGPDIAVLQCKILKRGCTIFHMWMHLYQWRWWSIGVNLI